MECDILHVLYVWRAPQNQSSVPYLFLALLHQRLDVKLDAVFFWILSSFLRWFCFYFAFAMFLYSLLLLFHYISCRFHLYLIILFPSLSTNTFFSNHLSTYTASCHRRSRRCRSSFLVHCIPAYTVVLSKHLSRLHGYTVHQHYPSLYFPTDAHNVKKRRVIKTF